MIITSIIILFLLILLSELMIYKTDISVKNMKIIVLVLNIIYIMYIAISIPDFNILILSAGLSLIYLGTRWELSDKKQFLILTIYFITCYFKLKI